MAGNKRKVQEINAGSMADIAFLLLIFFLVATTMNTDTGLLRVLPPMPDKDQKQEDIKVKERNLLLVFVSKSNYIMAGGQQMDIHQLKDKAKEFILNPMDDENLPEKKMKEFELPDGSKWTYPVSDGVIWGEVDRVPTRYDMKTATSTTYDEDTVLPLGESRDGSLVYMIASRLEQTSLYALPATPPAPSDGGTES